MGLALKPHFVNIVTTKQIDEIIMKHTVYTLTAPVLTEMFGDDCDWYSVLKNGKRVGTFSELRAKVLHKQQLEDKAERKKFHDKIMKQKTIKETFDYLEQNAPKNANVFMNQTQPNIHMNGHKVYVVCGPVEKVRMSITHKSLSFDEMQLMIEHLGYSVRSNKSAKTHISFDGVMPEQIFGILNILCGE